MNAIAAQAYLGAYLPPLLDCNSCRNACVAIRLLLARLEAAPGACARIYFYTR